MIKNILKLIRKTNKKSYRKNSHQCIYPHVHCRNSKIVGYVYKRRKRHFKIKRYSRGPEKYIVRVYGDDFYFSISENNIKIFQSKYVINMLLPQDTLLFEGKDITKGDYFNLLMNISDIPTPDDMQKIRNFMKRKDTRYNTISVHLYDYWPKK